MILQQSAAAHLTHLIIYLFYTKRIFICILLRERRKNKSQIAQFILFLSIDFISIFLPLHFNVETKISFKDKNNIIRNVTSQCAYVWDASGSLRSDIVLYLKDFFPRTLNR